MIDAQSAIDRRVALRRTSNMRDLGGLPSGDGRTLRRGVVFRAGGVHHLEGTDVDTVRELGLRTVVDLRTHAELSRHGEVADGLAPRRFHYPMVSDIWDRRKLGDEESLESYFVGRYEQMLELGTDAITATLHLLAEADTYPLLFFCAAGKDRTGVMAAVLLRLLDVADEAIVADYVLSGPEIARLLAEMGDQERWTSERMGGGAPRLLTAPAGVMRGFLARLPPADDLAQTLDLSTAARHSLRELLLEPSPPADDG